MLSINPCLRPPLDAGFLPASLWNRAYRILVAGDRHARPFAIALANADGATSVYHGRVLAADHPAAPLNLRYAERLLKFLLWQKGGCRVLIAGADELAGQLARIYSAAGARAFDHGFMGEKVFRRPFSVEKAESHHLAEIPPAGVSVGRHLDGCRIGFDIGGSDRKVAAVIDGQVVYSDEVSWTPCFQSDPSYHIEGIHDSLRRAAAHLPRVEAIGGSAAGIYMRNEVRVASLFRGIPADLFEKHIRRMFFTLQERWGGVPFEVANDGEVTALAGSMALGDNAVLGISMGTSQAGGYVTPDGDITPWLNELAFAPIDYRPDAPRDEWSGDNGCGVQYFSQQGVARLAAVAGFAFPESEPVAERLLEVQQAMNAGDARARRIYDSVGIYLGYAIAHYAEFYAIRHLLVLGRVLSGAGGQHILDRATDVLRADFPELAAQIKLHLPDEKERRHGQAIAAASLPTLAKS